MTNDSEFLNLSVLQSSIIFDHRRQKRLLRGFWVIAFALFTFELFFTNTESLVSIFGAILITAAALFPTYLWCSRKALGMPIFPLFALTYVWTHALPLVSNHPIVVEYSPESHLFASLTVTGFLGLGTFIWFQFVKSTPSPPESYLALNGASGYQFFLLALAANIFFNTYFLAGWIFLDAGIFAIICNVTLALSSLATFVLAYRLGSQELSGARARWFILLLVISIVVNAASLLLVGAASIFLIAIFAFTIGRKKLPILVIIISLICFCFLNYGKGEMRAKYWFGGEYSSYIQPWEYPAWYSEWAGYSLNYLLRNKNSNDVPSSQETEERSSFLERSSVIQMLLLAQIKSPQEIPYLYGATYAILPQLLVPRIFAPQKIASHEGTYLLNIHYGLQTRETTGTTTIAWGLLAESYANFGLIGCGGLAVILGSIYGQSTRWSLNAPVLSAKYLFAILMMTFSFQTEFSAGVYVAALFQGTVALGSVIVLLMRTYKVPPMQN